MALGKKIVTAFGQAMRAKIETALHGNNMPEALRLADAALAAGQRDPMLFNLVAWRAEEALDFPAAHAALAHAIDLAPGDATIITAAGRALRKEGKMSAALAMFARATALDPGFAVPWLEGGFALEGAGEIASARAAYERAAELDPGLPPAWAGAASMAARQGDATAVIALAGRALAIDPRNAVAICAIALSEIERGAAATAAPRLAALLQRGGLAPEDRITALTLLGDAHDKLNSPTAAIAAWTEANADFAAFHAPRFRHQEPQRQFLIGLAKRVAAIDPATWSRRVAPAGHGPARGHVFLIGYPRSGTTLTENILASSSDVVALEERPTFADADDHLLDSDGLDRLVALDAARITALREAYWARVAGAGCIVAGKTFVDMNPLNGMKLPLIARLFPEARVVVMHRDPRDVVLSCFRQNFRVSAAAFAFTTLDEAARHYDAVMTLTEACLAATPLAARRLRYDRLIRDFDETTRELCAFIGIDWSKELRRFDKTAVRRGVTTASVGQVRRGLYDGGGTWRRYASALQPILPILTPWLLRFGFEPQVTSGSVAD